MSEEPLQHRHSPLPFDGLTYDHERDGKRLTRQLDCVRWLMLDGLEHTLEEISKGCGCSEASASARLRDLRKKKHGGWTIHRRYVGEGLFAYKLDVHTSNVIGKEE